MPLIVRSGKIYIYHILDIADTIDLPHLQKLSGHGTTVARLVARRPTPQYIQFANPPVSLPLGARTLSVAGRELRAVLRAKFFDYGAVSVIWELDSPAEWDELLAVSAAIGENPEIERQSRLVLDELRKKLEPALRNVHPDPLLEDYTIYYFRQFDQTYTASALLTQRSEELARLMRGELRTLSPEEINEAVKKHITYYEDDLVIIDWNTAIIIDPEETTEHLDILEFANTELLELRYYDRLLDRELDSIYDALQREPGTLPRVGRYMRTADKLMALMVDVIELTEKIENAIKVIGDLYSARVYRLIAGRLRLGEWKTNVDNKINIVNQIYHNRIERLNTSRFVTMEIIIIALIAVEIVLALIRH